MALTAIKSNIFSFRRIKTDFKNTSIYRLTDANYFKESVLSKNRCFLAVQKLRKKKQYMAAWWSVYQNSSKITTPCYGHHQKNKFTSILFRTWHWYLPRWLATIKSLFFSSAPCFSLYDMEYKFCRIIQLTNAILLSASPLMPQAHFYKLDKYDLGWRPRKSKMLDCNSKTFTWLDLNNSNALSG